MQQINECIMKMHNCSKKFQYFWYAIGYLQESMDIFPIIRF